MGGSSATAFVATVLPQVVMGAIGSGGDVGMAMDYLRLGATAKTMAALVVLATIPSIALWLTRHLLSLADDTAQIDSARARTRFVFQVATLPALIAFPLILPRVSSWPALLP